VNIQRSLKMGHKDAKQENVKSDAQQIRGRPTAWTKYTLYFFQHDTTSWVAIGSGVPGNRG
jgi:hypothetical protein